MYLVDQAVLPIYYIVVYQIKKHFSNKQYNLLFLILVYFNDTALVVSIFYCIFVTYNKEIIYGITTVY